MQIEKFFKAQELRKEIVDMESVIADLDGKSFDIKPLEKLSVQLKASLAEKGVEVIKKELTKFIRIREKEFNEL